MANEQKKLSPNDPIAKFLKDERKVKICDVVRNLIPLFAVLEENSPSFKAAKQKLTKQEWNGLMNTMHISILVNVGIAGLPEEEQMKYAIEISEHNDFVKHVGVAVMTDGSGEDD